MVDNRGPGLAVFAALLALGGVGCDDVGEETPERADILVFAVSDPDPAAGIPGRALWLSTRAGLAWVSTTSGRQIGDRTHVLGGQIVESFMPALELEPGLNDLVLGVAPDSGEEQLRATVRMNVAVDCTRTEHCPSGQRCDAYSCVAY